jgi:hypothetical protein
MRKLILPTLTALALAVTTSVVAQSPAFDPAKMPRIGQVDERYVSYNTEMVEVTGGRFWAPYKAGTELAPAPPPATTAGGTPALDPAAFRQRPPVDLSSGKLRTLAAALGPAYMRVSGTWANSTYFHDSDAPAPATPPKGFGSVLTRAQWRGVVEFAKAVNAEIVTSFAISDGTRDASGHWTPDQVKALLAYTSSIGGRIAAAEFFNEPNVAPMGGAPKGYDAATYGRDYRAFQTFIRTAAPNVRLAGPGSVGEGGMLANFPSIKSEAMLTASGPGLDVFSYHSYPGVSKRCVGLGSPIGQTTAENALTDEWLARSERDARFYVALRDRFEPGKPLWLTETGETGCGGNPWASTFTDSFRFVEQLARVAKLGVSSVMHNTLAASDYALIDEETLDPRPNYWAALLWRRLMGRTVLDAGQPPAPGLHVFAHCQAGAAGGVTILAVNADRTAAHDITLPVAGERYTLASKAGLLSHVVELNGAPLALDKDGRVPATRGAATKAGVVSLPAASITFVTLPSAGNASCR